MAADETRPPSEAPAAAQSLTDEGRIAFRLTNDTPLLTSADPTAPALRMLAAGSLVTVREDAGAFLHVVTSDDEFGYIDDETPAEPIIGTRAVEQRAPPGPAVAPLPLTSARALYEDAGSPTATARGIAGARAADDDWEPTPINLQPSERVLIYDRIAANKRSTWLLMGGFVLFLVAVFAAVGIVIGFTSDLTFDEQLSLAISAAVIAAVIGVITGAVMYVSATSIVMGISGAHEVTKAEAPVLYRIVENLSIGSGLPMPKVWVIEDSAPNAFATGRDPKNAHVVATRGLLDKLEKRELEAVMAHEMSHVGNYDIRLMTLVAVAVGLVALIADLMLRFTWYGSGSRSGNRDKGGGAIGAIILVVALLFLVLSPIIASMMRFALSRQREYLADASGALLCRNPDALADALQKISADPEPLEAANKATAHLYIENPLKEHQSFLNSLFATHPPVADRIKLLRAM